LIFIHVFLQLKHHSYFCWAGFYNSVNATPQPQPLNRSRANFKFLTKMTVGCPDILVEFLGGLCMLSHPHFTKTMQGVQKALKSHTITGAEKHTKRRKQTKNANILVAPCNRCTRIKRETENFAFTRRNHVPPFFIVTDKS
jgi:hypothetical protein